MKKITAMLIALTMAALTLTGCSSDEGSSSVTEQNVSGLASENETFVTTTTTAPIPTETTTEDNSLITADTREELAKGLLEAICAGDKDTIKRYGFSNKAYTSTQEILTESKEKAGLSVTDEVTATDFEIYITGPSDGGPYEVLDSSYDRGYVYIISPKLSSIEYKFQIVYDYDLEQYAIDADDRVGKSANSGDAYADNGYATHYDSVLPKLINVQPIQ